MIGLQRHWGENIAMNQSNFPGLQFVLDMSKVSDDSPSEIKDPITGMIFRNGVNDTRVVISGVGNTKDIEIEDLTTGNRSGLAVDGSGVFPVIIDPVTLLAKTVILLLVGNGGGTAAGALCSIGDDTLSGTDIAGNEFAAIMRADSTPAADANASMAGNATVTSHFNTLGFSNNTTNVGVRCLIAEPAVALAGGDVNAGSYTTPSGTVALPAASFITPAPRVQIGNLVGSILGMALFYFTDPPPNLELDLIGIDDMANKHGIFRLPPNWTQYS